VSWEATSAVIGKSKQKGSALLMMLIIGNYADPFGFAWPGIGKIAGDTRLSERNVQYLMRGATACGELDVFPKAGPVIQKGRSKGQRTNLFRITLCQQPQPEHPYFGIKRWCKDFTTSGAGVVQEPSPGGEGPYGGGASARGKVVQAVAPDPSSGSVNEPSGSSAVDNSTSFQNGKRRRCTHGKCGPEGCSYPGGDADRGPHRPDFSGTVDRLKVADTREGRR
jgi:hypothetical protein